MKHASGQFFLKNLASGRLLLLLFNRLNAKVAFIILFLTSTAIILSYSITIRVMNRQVKESIVHRAESLSRSLASAAGYHLILKDILALDNMVYKIKTANLDINSISIVGPDQQVIVHSDPEKVGTRLNQTGLVSGREDSKPGPTPIMNSQPGDNPAANRFLVIETPVSFLDQELGSVRLEMDWLVLRQAQSEAKRRVMPFFGLIMFLGLASSLVFSHRLTKPVRELARGVEQMKLQGKAQPVAVYSRDELGKLTLNFNEMTSLVRAQKEKLAAYAHELEEAYVATIRVLAAAVEARDRYTLGHSTRVAQLAIGLAKEAGLSKEDVEMIEIACLFHEVGKIRIPDAILHKRGRLEADEIREMKRHPEYGAEILSKAPCLYKYIPAVRHHHEWYNGNGYPDRLSGEAIPLAAAIISLADAYDAMTSDRPYRRALSPEEALQCILQNSGRQFHPDLATLMVRVAERLKNRTPESLRTLRQG